MQIKNKASVELVVLAVAVGDLENPLTDWSLLSDALKFLPKPHYNTLKYLAQHLYRYNVQATYVSTNKIILMLEPNAISGWIITAVKTR